MLDEKIVFGEGSTVDKALTMALSKAWGHYGADQSFKFEIKKIHGSYLGISGEKKIKVEVLIVPAVF